MSSPHIHQVKSRLNKSPKVLRQWITYMAEYGYFNEFKPANYPDCVYNYMSSYVVDIRVSLSMHTMLKFELFINNGLKLVRTINTHLLFVPDENKQTKCLASKYTSLCLRTMRYFKYNIDVINSAKFDINLNRINKTISIFVTPFETKRYSKILSTLKK